MLAEIGAALRYLFFPPGADIAPEQRRRRSQKRRREQAMDGDDDESSTSRKCPRRELGGRAGMERGAVPLNWLYSVLRKPMDNYFVRQAMEWLHPSAPPIAAEPARPKEQTTCPSYGDFRPEQATERSSRASLLPDRFVRPHLKNHNLESIAALRRPGGGACGRHYGGQSRPDAEAGAPKPLHERNGGRNGADRAPVEQRRRSQKRRREQAMDVDDDESSTSQKCPRRELGGRAGLERRAVPLNWLYSVLRKPMDNYFVRQAMEWLHPSAPPIAAAPARPKEQTTGPPYGDFRLEHAAERSSSASLLPDRFLHPHLKNHNLGSIAALRRPDVFPELTAEMEAAIEKALRPTPPDEVLARGFKLLVTRKDMETLAGLNWLNDEVINFYMNLLMERGRTEPGLPSVYAFNTFFYPKLLTSGHAALRRWTRHVDVFAHDMLLVPVHLGKHWCLAVVDFRTKSIRYLDSMGDSNPQCHKVLRQYLQDESRDKRAIDLDLSDWTFEATKDIPLQRNSSDCGMFALKYAEYITRDAKITFDQMHMPYFRRRMVYDILSKKLL
ncbi:unnamed protein product [Ixodes persulcatus]